LAGAGRAVYAPRRRLRWAPRMQDADELTDGASATRHLRDPMRIRRMAARPSKCLQRRAAPFLVQYTCSRPCRIIQAGHYCDGSARSSSPPRESVPPTATASAPPPPRWSAEVKRRSRVRNRYTVGNSQAQRVQRYPLQDTGWSGRHPRGQRREARLA
jgi:hypothetical protein